MSHERAQEMLEYVKRHGTNCGFFITSNTVVLRCPGSPYTDTPTIFDVEDLNGAIALGFLRKQEIVGDYQWEYYVAAQ